MKKMNFLTSERNLIELGASAFTMLLGFVALLLVVVIINGISVLWPKPVFVIKHKGTGELTLGVIHNTNGKEETLSYLIETGNKDIDGTNFVTISARDIESIVEDTNAVILERLTNGRFIGYLGERFGYDQEEESRMNSLEAKLAESEPALRKTSEKLKSVNERIRELEYEIKEFQYQKRPFAEIDKLETEKQNLYLVSDKILEDLSVITGQNAELVLRFRDVEDKEALIPVSGIVRFHRPGTMNLLDKLGYFFSKIYEFLFAEPRESNTEGGVFPAIIGTVSLVMIMSIFAFPLGVITAIYLTEYAGNNFFTRTVRVAISNLAGIPSIVYGVFGLGFLIYGVGGFIDTVFYAERLPEPTFGTGGLLWASLTLSILTVPVVIVATEEALSSVPLGLKHSSLALGATKLQTLARVILPNALPGIITGFILSISRAAGEVAPLMVTGVVKLAPELPIDFSFPFFHLERKFMHLGFHIYDVGFQSPDSEAAKPMVFLTTLVLLLIVLILNSGAIVIRERMRRKLKQSSI